MPHGSIIKPDMSFAYEDEGKNTLTGLDRLAADHPIKAIIIAMAIEMAIIAGSFIGGWEIAGRVSGFDESTEIQK